MNMAHARFRNTLDDLLECESSDGMGEPEALNAEERKARAQLIKVCGRIAGDYADDE